MANKLGSSLDPMRLSCYGCGCENVYPLRAYRDLPGTIFHNMQLFECEHCSLCFAWPPPTQEAIEKYYVDSYWQERKLNSWARCAREHWQQIDHARAQLSFIAESFPDLCFEGILDIGAGFGEFLDEAQRLGGRNLCAVEVSDDSAKILQSHGFAVIRKIWGGPETTALVLHELPIVRLIRASHVLEHTATPRDFLRCVASILDKDGVFMCEVPHDSRETLLLPIKNRPRDAPHLLFFSESSLRRLLEMSDLKVVASGIFGNPDENRDDQPSASLSMIKKLLPAPIVRLTAGVRAIMHHTMQTLDWSKSSSWHRNPKGSWLRKNAVKKR